MSFKCKTVMRLSLGLIILGTLGCEDNSVSVSSDRDMELVTSDMAQNDELDLMSSTMIDMEVDTDMTSTEENLDPEGVAPGDISVLQLQEMKALNFAAFTTSEACALCHSNHFAATAMRNQGIY